MADAKTAKNPFAAVAAALEGATADDIKGQLGEFFELIAEHLLDQPDDIAKMDAGALSGHMAAVAKELGIDNTKARDIVGVVTSLGANVRQGLARDAKTVADAIAAAVAK